MASATIETSWLDAPGHRKSSDAATVPVDKDAERAELVHIPAMSRTAAADTALEIDFRLAIVVADAAYYCYCC